MADIEHKTQEEQAEDLIQSFEWLDSLEEQYQYLIDLGRKLPPMNEADKIEANRVHGCQSQVWLVAHPRPAEPQIIDFDADSDAHIVRGLVAILKKIYSGQPAAKILSFDIEGFLKQVGLDQHLSLGRRNGLGEMVKRIKTLAATVAQQNGASPNGVAH